MVQSSKKNPIFTPFLFMFHVITDLLYFQHLIMLFLNHIDVIYIWQDFFPIF